MMEQKARSFIHSSMLGRRLSRHKSDVATQSQAGVPADISIMEANAEKFARSEEAEKFASSPETLHKFHQDDTTSDISKHSKGSISSTMDSLQSTINDSSAEDQDWHERKKIVNRFSA